MKSQEFAEGFKKAGSRKVNIRKIAEHHAFGAVPENASGKNEKNRILALAVNEAEALACETGVPELVLLTLAEEKVRNARAWFARQEDVKARSFECAIAA
jgi:hypothetical protein